MVETTVAEEMLIALDRAAWECDHAVGNVPAIGRVEIKKHNNRRYYWLDGKRTTASILFQSSRGAP